MSLLLRASRLMGPTLRRGVLHANASLMTRNHATPLVASGLQFIRRYHDEGVYGYRVPTEYAITDYTSAELDNRNANANLLRLVLAFRNHGHRAADLDPLGIQEKWYDCMRVC